jgi:hypothetical protein
MPTRREFVESATVMLLMIPLTRCSENTSSNVVVPPDGAVPDGGDGAAAEGAAPEAAPSGCASNPTSTTVLGHAHMVCVLATDLANPPAGGVTYTTTTSSSATIASHNHTVTLTAAQLATINAGQSVTVTTSITTSHTHDFIIMKM